MTGNSFYDACRMFKHACSFVDCAKFCETEPIRIVPRTHDHIVAGIVNSSFACEVFIKSILVYHKMSIDEIKKLKHGLWGLWNKLGELDSEFIKIVETKVKETFVTENKDFFNEALLNISDSFATWRYIYEKHSASIHINFLRIFREALRSACCEKLYKMSWNEYVEGDYKWEEISEETENR